MTSYEFEVVSDGEWSDADDWLNQSSGKLNDGTPGAGDTAYVYADFGTTTSLSTEMESVATVIGVGEGSRDLVGLGLNISGELIGIELAAGAYTVDGLARAVTVDSGATLSGNAIGGTQPSEGGVTVNGGAVTASKTFWGVINAGSVASDKVLSVSMSGGDLSAKTIALNGVKGGELDETAGSIVATSISIVGAFAGGYGTISGGAFDDQGALSISGTLVALNGKPTPIYGTLNFTGGSATVAGAVTIANFGGLGVSSAGQLQLQAGLTIAADAGSKSQVSVGSPAGAGGTLTVSGGNLDVGLGGTGQLTIADGGTVTAVRLYVGVKTKSSGTVSVSGAGSALTLTGAGAFVGDEGTGRLLLSNGGSLTIQTAAGFDIGAEKGGIGVVTVDGATTTFNLNGAALRVGDLGAGKLIVKDGEQVTAGNVEVAVESQSTGVLSVQGENTQLTASSLSIGGGKTSGGDGAVSVANGKLLVTGETTIWEEGRLTITTHAAGVTDGIVLEGALLNEGTLTAQSGVLIDGAVTGVGAINIDDSGLVVFGGSVASAQRVAFEGPNAEIQIKSPSAFHAKISGFAYAGDGIQLSSVAYNTNSKVKLVGNTLVLTPVGGASVRLTLAGALPGGVALRQDPGDGGTEIYVSKPAAAASVSANLTTPSAIDLLGAPAAQATAEFPTFPTAFAGVLGADGAAASFGASSSAADALWAPSLEWNVASPSLSGTFAGFPAGNT